MPRDILPLAPTLAKSIQSTLLTHRVLKIHFNIILQPIYNPYPKPLSFTRATCPIHLILVDLQDPNIC
jgi:hypothetical protein